MDDLALGDIEDIVGRFEAAWNRNNPPVIDAFLPSEATLRREVLEELLHVDLEFRVKAELPIRVEDYLKQYPELAEATDTVVNLIVAEYRFRSRSKNAATPQQFFDRFPRLRDQLAEKLSSDKSAPQGSSLQDTLNEPSSKQSTQPPVSQVDLIGLPVESRALIDHLIELQLLTLAQLDGIAAYLHKLKDAASTIAELSNRGLLTAYQADQIRKNKTKQLVFGSYLLLEPIGKGGMGQVFKARHRVMKRIVALKIIRKGHLPHGEAVQRFTQEIEAAAKLSHPNIVTAHDAGRAGDFHFFVMEYIEGTGLDSMLKKDEPIPVGLACELVRQTALGLQHAHDQGLVHRDIKPQNLILDSRGTVKILDMGLARVRYDPAGGGAKALTQMGAIMGTADFIAPEQIIDCSRVDGRADIYSLGCTLYQLLTGRPPCPGSDLRTKLEQHVRGTPRRVREFRADIPEKVEAILSKMMARKPNERYGSAAEVAQALQPFAIPLAIAAPAKTNDASASTAATFIEPPAVSPAQRDGNKPESAKPAEKKRAVSAAGGIAIGLGVLGIGGGMLLALGFLAFLFWPRTPPAGPPPRVLSVLDKLSAERIPAGRPKDLPKEVVAIFQAPPKSTNLDAYHVRFSGSGKYLWAATEKELLQWDLEAGQLRTRIPIKPALYGMDISARGSLLVHSSGLMIDAEEGKVLQEIPDLDPTVDDVAISANERHVLFGKRGTGLWLRDTVESTWNKEFKICNGCIIRAVATSPDGRYAAFGGDGVRLQVLELPECKEIGSWPHQGGIYGVAFSPDGKHLFASDGAGVKRWNRGDSKEAPKRYPGVSARSIRFTPDGKYMVTTEHQKNTILWDVESTDKLREWKLGGFSWEVCFAPDGRHLATANADGTVCILRLWEADEAR